MTRRDIAKLHLKITGPWAYVFAWGDKPRAELAAEFERMVSSCFFTISREQHTYTCELTQVFIPPITPTLPATPTTVVGALWLAWQIATGQRREQ